eukprot:GEMP01012079.1.p1 GENE.GEMP01012079.1~~GEMP01012079.1.p1  ORF type:complete len:718 (+),score=221.80 GEMP01012079.1:85-2154(+)
MDLDAVVDNLGADVEARVHAWLDGVHLSLLGHIPLTGSIDIRDSPDRSVIVDCNRFPAGFQYVSAQDVGRGSELVRRALRRHCVETPRHVHVFTEAHTRLVYYQDNVEGLKALIQGALPGATVTASPSSTTADYTVLNADLSDPNQVDDAEAHIDVQQTCMGWHRRSKSVNIALMAPWLHIMAKFLHVPHSTFEAQWGVSSSPCFLEEPTHARALATQIAAFDSMAADVPTSGSSGVFVKNACGTYGLGVTWIPPGPVEDILSHLTRRDLDKMTYARHGQRADRFVLQEGVPTCLFSLDGRALEVVVMCVDGEFCSYFIRQGPTQSERAAVGNLNAPGSEFVTRDEFESSPHFAEAARVVQGRLPIYKILARIACIAMAQEQIVYQGQLNAQYPSLLPSSGSVLHARTGADHAHVSTSEGRSPSVRAVDSNAPVATIVDREKEFRAMLSDAMRTVPFKNRIAKQRFAQEANKVRKSIVKHGGSTGEFAARLADLSAALADISRALPANVEATAPPSAPSKPAWSTTQTHGDRAAPSPTPETNVSALLPSSPTRADHTKTAPASDFTSSAQTCGDCAAPSSSTPHTHEPTPTVCRSAELPPSQKEKHAQRATKKNAAVPGQGVSGCVKHSIDVALRQALTAFLQQAPPGDARRVVAANAQRVKREVLDSVRDDSVVADCVAHFVGVLQEM